MLPAAALIASNPATVQKGFNVGKWLLLAILAGLGVYFTKKWYDNTQKKNTELEAGKSDNTPESIAQILYAELVQAWNTDEEKVIRIGNQINDLPAVKNAYQKLYKRSLDDDLAKALNTNELERFKRNTTEAKAGTNKATGERYAPKGSRTPQYNAKISAELVKALKYDCTFCVAWAEDLVEISTRIYDFDGPNGVAYQFAWQTRNMDKSKPKGLDLRTEINDKIWKDNLEAEFWRNIERNRNLKEQP